MGVYLQIHLPLELLDNPSTDCTGSFGRFPSFVLEAAPLGSDTKLVICDCEVDMVVTKNTRFTQERTLPRVDKKVKCTRGLDAWKFEVEALHWFGPIAFGSILLHAGKGAGSVAERQIIEFGHVCANSYG